MVGLISTFLLPLVLIGFAHGAPMQYASPPSDSCSWWKYVRDDVKCLPEILTVGMDLVTKFEKGMDEESEMNVLSETCIPLQKCFATTECLSIKLEKLKLACDSVVYLKSPRFLECERNMKIDLFFYPNGNDCDIFGENNFIAGMMEEACGRDEWVRYRDLRWKTHQMFGDAERCYNKQFENL